MLDVAKFRNDFPEFSNGTRYTDAAINFWSGIGDKLLSPDRWGDLHTQGLSLFTAHNIALAAGNSATAGAGGVPGQTNGVVSAKTVGSASVSYDVASLSELNAGHWNQTVYGRQYIRLVRLLGQGCYQL